MKINVDAVVGRWDASVGAVIRDLAGALLSTIVFPLLRLPPLRVELQEAVYVTIFYAP